MTVDGPEQSIDCRIEELYRSSSRRIFASLVRLVHDFDIAEEALQDAFTIAAATWPSAGMPANPRAWLVSTGRFKAIDALRRQSRYTPLQDNLGDRTSRDLAAAASRSDDDIEDDRLRLIFACCHPAISPAIQVALTLREVCGLSTEAIAAAFLTSPTTMAQRLVRGKAKIRDAGIPIVIPGADDLPNRIDSVLSVIYLVFSEGYSAATGSELTRSDLSAEAIRLGRLVFELLPDAEAKGLLALMLLQESRRLARTTSEGDLVLLDDQNRGLWNQSLIAEGVGLVDEIFTAGLVGSYSIQAAIAATHARAATPGETDWPEIVALYDLLVSNGRSPVIELNRAVAVAMRDGPESGLAAINEIFSRGELTDYHLAHAAHADLLRRIGDINSARIAYTRALELAQQEPEHRFLLSRLRSL